MADGEALVRVLEAAERAGGGPPRRLGREFVVRCPAHDDRHPSLNIAQGNTGAVVICRAGCDNAAVLQALGLEPRDLFDTPITNGSSNGLGTAVASYEYTDEQGRRLFKIVRYVPKTFRPFRWLGTDYASFPGLEDKDRGTKTRRVLYRLPKVIEAVAKGETVYVVEGERDVHALERVGIVATTNPGGVGKWGEDYNQHFRGANVVVVADNDEPGIAHARAVETSLRPHVASLRLVKSATGKHKDDASDHLAAGHGVDDFVPLDDEPVADDPVSDDGPEPLSIPAPDFLRLDFGEPKWLVTSLWDDQAVGFIGGEPKTYKSWIALELAVAVATGVPAFGRFDVPRPGPVLVIQEESKGVSFQARIAALATGHGLNDDDLGRLHVANQRRVKLDDDASAGRLVAEVERLRPVLVVLDPLVRLHRADENVAKDMNPIFDFMRRLQADHGTAVAVIHHTRKADGTSTRAGQRLRGTGDFHGLLDSAIYTKRRAHEQTVQVTGEHREAPDPEAFTFTVDYDPDRGVARLAARDGTLDDQAAIDAMTTVEGVIAASDGMTKAEIEGAVNKRRDHVRNALSRLYAAGRAVPTQVEREDTAGRKRKTTVWKVP